MSAGKSRGGALWGVGGRRGEEKTEAVEEGRGRAQNPRHGCQSCKQLCPISQVFSVATRLGPLGKLLWKMEGGVQNPDKEHLHLENMDSFY